MFSQTPQPASGKAIGKALRRTLPFLALAALVLAIVLLPRMALGVGTGSGSLTIQGSVPPPLPAPVGTVIPVGFIINITGDNNQTESGPATITNEVFTINAAPGMVVSAGGPQGYTTTGTGTSTATVKGTGETSFTISAGVEYTDAEAGTQSVTCNGTVYFSDGTNAPNSGTVQVTAVAVDSVALADNPQDVQIGQTLTRSDFTITTTPSGFGDYTFPQTTSYLVDWSMSPQSTVQVGDNTVTASCGDTYATYDLTAQSISGAWTGAAAGATDQPDTASFQAESDGFAGTWSVDGSAADGTANGALPKGTPISQTVYVSPPSDDVPGSTEADLHRDGQAVVVARMPAINPLPLLLQNQKAVVAPALPGNARQLQTNAPSASAWVPTQSVATGSITPGGVGVYAIGLNGNNQFYLYTRNASAAVEVAMPNPASATWGGVQTTQIYNEATVVDVVPGTGLISADVAHGGLANGPAAQAVATGSAPGKSQEQQVNGSGELQGPQWVQAWTTDTQSWTLKW